MSGSVYRIAVMGMLALLTVSLVTVAAVLLVRGNANAPIQIVAPASGPSDSSLSGNGEIPPHSPTPAPDLQVYVHGAVQRPGVYPVLPGDRLADALNAAGGANDDANLAAVNLAQRVQDEGYYYIPQVGETPPPVAISPGRSTSPLAADLPGNTTPGSGLIDLNTASVETLMALPGIGQVRAQAIVAYREQNGPFASVEQVMEVHGIGQGTYENIRELATVGGR